MIKKFGLESDDVRSYRPISNLTFMSKIVERMVHKQLTDYLGKYNLLPKHQSGFRAHHSTETAVLKIMSDILIAADHGNVTLLGLLDMSAAFDTVDHSILLDWLGTSFGLEPLLGSDHSSSTGSNRSFSMVTYPRLSTSPLVFHKEAYWDRYYSSCTPLTSQSLQTYTGLVSTATLTMDKSMCLTRLERPTEWSLRCQPALNKLTHG